MAELVLGDSRLVVVWLLHVFFRYLFVDGFTEFSFPGPWAEVCGHIHMFRVYLR